jgi:hypothetical protein
MLQRTLGFVSCNERLPKEQIFTLDELLKFTATSPIPVVSKNIYFTPRSLEPNCRQDGTVRELELSHPKVVLQRLIPEFTEINRNNTEFLSM